MDLSNRDIPLETDSQHDAHFLITGGIQNHHNKTPHISAMRGRQGVSLVSKNFDLYSASITAVLYTISCYIGLCNNGNQLYIPWCHQSVASWVSCRSHAWPGLVAGALLVPGGDTRWPNLPLSIWCFCTMNNTNLIVAVVKEAVEVLLLLLLLL